MNCSILIVALLSIAIQSAPSTSPAAAPATAAPATAAPATAPSVVTSPDGSIEVALPSTWQVVVDQKHRDFQLFVSSPPLRMSIGVKTYAKDDLVDMSLEKMDQSSREQMNWLTDLQTGEAREVKINGNSAIEHDLSGTSGNARYEYLCTTIETPKQYFCFYCVTTPTRFEKAVPIFQEVIHSARDVLDSGK